ncbi:MAG: TIR domain-containing protein [Candidatus Gracilibacteria bacterium]
MKRVFISFSHNDIDHVRGLRLLNSNPNFDLEFYDQSIKEAIDSENADYIKRVISDQIKRSSVTVCLISESTHLSKWVDWELNKSKEHGNLIIVMAIKGVESAILPSFIKDNDVAFLSWDPIYLTQLLNQS